MAVSRKDDFDVPETGAIFALGKSKFGDRLFNKFWLKHDGVQSISCGDEHTAIVSESGDLFMFGSNEWGQLGLGHTNAVTKPTRIKHKALKHEKVVMVECGRHHTILLTGQGNLYAMGSNGEGQLGKLSDSSSSSASSILVPTEIQLRPPPGVSVKMLSCGAEHTCCLFDNGDVHLWGSNSESQLGTSSNDATHLDIQAPVTWISCGYYHTAVVTENGDLYTFGESECGKLGQGTADVGAEVSKPRLVNITPGGGDGVGGSANDSRVKIVNVACGGSHTICVCDDGHAYSFGEGDNGQLGHGTNDVEQISQPRRIHFKGKRKVRIKQAFCGENNTALLSDQGDLYTSGDGRHAKLGHGEENFSNQFFPLLVKRFQYFKIDKVSCGGCHMIVTGKLKPSSTSEEADDFSQDSADEESPTDTQDDLELTAARSRHRHQSFTETSLSRTLPPLTASLQQSDLLPLLRERKALEQNEIDANVEPTLKPTPRQRKRISATTPTPTRSSQKPSLSPPDSDGRAKTRPAALDNNATPDATLDVTLDRPAGVSATPRRNRLSRLPGKHNIEDEQDQATNNPRNRLREKTGKKEEKGGEDDSEDEEEGAGDNITSMRTRSKINKKNDKDDDDDDGMDPVTPLSEDDEEEDEDEDDLSDESSTSDRESNRRKQKSPRIAKKEEIKKKSKFGLFSKKETKKSDKMASSSCEDDDDEVDNTLNRSKKKSASDTSKSALAAPRKSTLSAKKQARRRAESSSEATLSESEASSRGDEQDLSQDDETTTKTKKKKEQKKSEKKSKEESKDESQQCKNVPKKPPRVKQSETPEKQINSDNSQDSEGSEKNARKKKLKAKKNNKGDKGSPNENNSDDGQEENNSQESEQDSKGKKDDKDNISMKKSKTCVIL